MTTPTTSTAPEALPGPVGAERRWWRRIYDADPIGYLTACRDRWGDVFALDEKLVVVCSPDLVHRVLVATNRESVPNPDLLDGNRLPTPKEIRSGCGCEG